METMGISEERIRSEVRRLAETLAPTLGLEVVEVAFHRAGRFTLLRVDIDRPGTPGVGCDAGNGLAVGRDEKTEGWAADHG